MQHKFEHIEKMIERIYGEVEYTGLFHEKREYLSTSDLGKLTSQPVREGYVLFGDIIITGTVKEDIDKTFIKTVNSPAVSYNAQTETVQANINYYYKHFEAKLFEDFKLLGISELDAFVEITALVFEKKAK